MHELIDWQDEFARALANPALPIPDIFSDLCRSSCRERFTVYRNNVTLGLMDALRDIFPVTLRIVGDDFFDAMARLYAKQNLPRSPVLLEYGADFAEFVEEFAPAASLPYLADVCRIEKAWMESYHALEAAPIGMDAFYALRYHEQQRMRLELHPSLRLLRSRFPALTIWSTNVNGSTPIPVNLEGNAENSLIVRPRAEVETLALSHAEMEFVLALANGCSVSTAGEMPRKADARFSAQDALEAMISFGLVVGFKDVPIRRGK